MGGEGESGLTMNGGLQSGIPGSPGEERLVPVFIGSSRGKLGTFLFPRKDKITSEVFC